MAKCAKCGKEIPKTGDDNPNWKLYCKKCVPSVDDLIKEAKKKCN